MKPTSAIPGSLIPDGKTGKTRIGDLGVDAQLVPARDVIVTNAKFEPMEMTEIFGPQSFHNGDYLLFYNGSLTVYDRNEQGKEASQVKRQRLSQSNADCKSSNARHKPYSEAPSQARLAGKVKM